MVEIEEIDEKEEARKSDAPATEPVAKASSAQGKKYRPAKKDLPSVAHLLAHGAPESQGKPKTFCSVFGYPIFVAVCFAISLLIFHYAPHDKSVQPRGKFSLPKRNMAPQNAAPPQTLQEEETVHQTHESQPEIPTDEEPPKIMSEEEL
jgi:hypothetical protein